MYKRKTEDVWNILQQTTDGWEVVNAETSWKAAKESLKEYRENQPELAVKSRKTREKIEEPKVTAKRVDIKAILRDPVQRRELLVRSVIATQAREGIVTTRAQAEAAVDKIQKKGK